MSEKERSKQQAGKDNSRDVDSQSSKGKDRAALEAELELRRSELRAALELICSLEEQTKSLSEMQRTANTTLIDLTTQLGAMNGLQAALKVC